MSAVIEVTYVWAKRATATFLFSIGTMAIAFPWESYWRQPMPVAPIWINTAAAAICWGMAAYLEWHDIKAVFLSWEQWREERSKLPSILPTFEDSPSGLNFELKARGGGDQRAIFLDPVIITNRSRQNLSLSFRLAVKTGESWLWLDGEWNGTIQRLHSGDQVVNVNAVSSVSGELVFHLWFSAASLDKREWPILEPGENVLEIYERISGKRIGCDPLRGYPPAIAIPEATPKPGACSDSVGSYDERDIQRQQALEARREAWRQLAAEFKSSLPASISLYWQPRDDDQRERDWAVHGYTSVLQLGQVKALSSSAGQRIIESPGLARRYAGEIAQFGDDPIRLWWQLLGLVNGVERVEYGHKIGTSGEPVLVFWGNVPAFAAESAALCITMASHEAVDMGGLLS